MQLRRLTDNGIEQFSGYLDQLKADPKLAPPAWLLTDADASERVKGDVEVEPRTFGTRLEAARYLDGLLSAAEVEQTERDAGLWAWLTLLYFDEVCPVGKGGNRKPRERIKYVPAVSDFQKYYRHLLLGPYVVWQAHRNHLEDALCLLLSPVAVLNDIVEQLASRRGWITNRTVVGVATKLYVDDGGSGYKRGAGSKGPGSPRRLSEVLEQFDLTYDLYGMSCQDLLRLLPKEFERFLN